MALQALRNKNNLGSAQTFKNYSPNIWADCPWEAIKEGSVSGVWIEDDFTSQNITAATTEGNFTAGIGYSQFTSSNGTITAGTGQGGELVLGSSSGSDNDAMSFRTLQAPFLFQRTAGPLWFEARIKMSSIADTISEIFLGFMENTSLTAIKPITTTAARLADLNLLGFYRTESDGDAIATVYKANGTPTSTTHTTVAAAEIVPVADTYLKLGIKYSPAEDPFVHDPNRTGGNRYLVTFYKDNLRLASYVQLVADSAAGTSFPNDIGLGLVLCQRYAAGSIQPTTTIDKWRCAQLL